MIIPHENDVPGTRIQRGGGGVDLSLSPSARETLVKAAFSLMMSAILLQTCGHESRGVSTQDTRTHGNSENGADHVENEK